MPTEELFYSIFENIPRQGPGTKAATIKAFSVIKKNEYPLTHLNNNILSLYPLPLTSVNG